MSDGPLTVAQAVAELSAAEETPQPVTTPAPETTAPEPEIETDAPSVENASEAEQPGDGEEVAEETEQAEAIKLDPPGWWSKEAKAKFAALDPDLQAEVYRQEENRERITQKAKQDSAEDRKKAEAEAAEYRKRSAQIDAWLPKAVETFRGKWDGVDWAALPAEIGAEETLKFRAQYETELGQLREAQAEAQRNETERFMSFSTERVAKLKEIAPELADEKTGPERVKKIADALLSQGRTQAELRWITAEEAAWVNDALKWREAQAAMANRPKPLPKPQAVAPVVKPAAAASASSKSAALKSAEGRFNADPSRKNLEALLALQG